MNSELKRNNEAFDFIYERCLENIFLSMKSKIFSEGERGFEKGEKEIFEKLTTKEKEVLINTFRIFFDETIAHVFFAIEDSEENDEGKITLNSGSFKVNFPSEYFLSYLENRGDSPLYPPKKKV